MSAAERVEEGLGFPQHALSDDDGRGDRATGVEECDLVPWRQIERRATVECAGHALALIIDYIRNTANRDALARLYHDIAVDGHTRRARCYLRALGIEHPKGKALQVPRLGIVVGYREEVDAAALVGRLNLIEGHVGIARVVLDLHRR